ncbi:MAG: citrate/2-methylcitrate synthase [Phycisphaerales bacterium JB058]|mgnify:FL=1|jgi:citrate synthase
MSTYAKGLEGVVAAETQMSWIDGVNGVLEYVGINIDALAQNSTFEETVYLLWNKKLPTRAELDAFTKELRQHYSISDGIVESIRKIPTTAEPMHVLRTLISELAFYDDDPNANDVESARKKAINILGQAPTLVAAYDRIRRGLDPVKPNTEFGFSQNFLYMLNGEKPTDTMARAFDICMITHADHGLNNSTFAARVVISTLSDVYSALTAAVGSLRGPLHGGANEGVMKMLNEIPSVDAVEEYVLNKLKNKDRIMGFGHRVYKAKDPRANELQKLAEQLAKDTGNEALYLKSNKIEEIMAREVGAKGIYPNVDFYSATTYHCIGLKLDLFTPMFAMSRLGGWSGHVIEQLSDNRLFRPKAEFTGDHGVPYVPIDERK